ncbi:MAG TPA: hypothetical protein VGX23_06780 [Actinocrinis sp.]|nr:hypothetical protein [Actinocrinis sp.]
MTALLDRPVGRQLPAPGRHTAVRTMLSTMERVLFRGDALAVARANAWSAVQEDKARARERAEAGAAFAGPAQDGATLR